MQDTNNIHHVTLLSWSLLEPMINCPVMLVGTRIRVPEFNPLTGTQLMPVDGRRNHLAHGSIIFPVPSLVGCTWCSSPSVLCCASFNNQLARGRTHWIVTSRPRWRLSCFPWPSSVTMNFVCASLILKRLTLLYPRMLLLIRRPCNVKPLVAVRTSRPSFPVTLNSPRNSS